MSQNQSLNKFTITQQSDQQLQIIAPNLFSNKERINIFQTLLLMQEAIEDVKIDPKTNAVSIDYNSSLLPKENLTNLLSTVLKNFDQKPLQSKEKKQTKSGNTEQTISFKVKGMSCNSCALFLELVLSRNSDVKHANINYESTLGTVKSCLNKEDIFHIIEKNGYQVDSIDVIS